ncbi:class I glutamine amidotransferase-like protein [Phanerochaete sordida]|uniref:Class I glutamine amidotransferase-like protein n=1 Tax=Phanerochaete sordida TaxID=48140 RepID=A0A9P3GG08_9APHY|nr:class I glutamine amidotransferase-like protein [Phanerochaete sordida]
MAPLRVGVLLAGKMAQFLDVAPVDILTMFTKSQLQEAGVADSIIAQGVDMELLYIAAQGSGLFQLTAGLRVEVTHGFDNTGQLDYLLVPGGTSPHYHASEAEKAFVRAQLPQLQALLGICTGAFVVAEAGVLDGVTATGPRGLLPMYRKAAPEVRWVEKRWEVEGKIWTSGGVANGNDLMAAFVRKTFPQLAEFILSVTDTGDRGQFYPDQV